MDDLIRRQDAIDAIDKDIMGGLNYERILRKVPSAEPEPKTGKWVYKTTDAYIQRTCSACGWSERMYYRNRNQDGLIRNYCPNCGSDMRGE